MSRNGSQRHKKKNIHTRAGTYADVSILYDFPSLFVNFHLLDNTENITLFKTSNTICNIRANEQRMLSFTFMVAKNNTMINYRI